MTAIKDVSGFFGQNTNKFTGKNLILLVFIGFLASKTSSKTR